MSVAQATPEPETTAPSREALLERKVAKLSEELASYKKNYDALLLAYERLRRQLFGKKGEQLTAAQLAFAWEAAKKEVGVTGPQLPPPPSSDDAKKPKERKASKRRNLSDVDLPEEVIVLTPPGLPEGAVRVSEDVAYKLEYQRARFVKLKIVRPIFKTLAPEGEEAVLLQSEPPHEMIPRGLLGHALLAYLLTAKWMDHLPYHRQEGIFARHGMSLDRSVMCRTEKEAANLCRGVVEAARKDAIAHAAILAADATGTLVQNKDACKRGHFFVSIADDDYVFFDFVARHTQVSVQTLFGGFTGYFQADASSVYESLYRGEKASTEVGCLAHCRRKYHEAIRSEKDAAMTGLGFLQSIFAIEKETEGLAPVQRLRIRQERAGPIWKSFLAWCEKEQVARAKERSPIARAVRYTLNHQVALGRFLEDGRLKLTNNACERELRSVVLGRHNWLFVGSDEDAEQSAVFISLIASCKLHGLVPEDYLRELFRVLPQWPSSRLLELHPRFWAWTRARLNVDELAAHYATITVPEKAPLPMKADELDQPDSKTHAGSA